MDLLDPAAPRLQAPAGRDGQVAGVAGAPAKPAESGHRLARRVEAIVTRAIALTVAIVVLVLLSPLLLAIAIAIRLTSEGPVIFKQQRVGKDMRSFALYKFRTMRPNASDEPHRTYVNALLASDETSHDGNLYKLTVDDRITGIGRFLRSWSLDEIPQLINVLRGEMALVGPRPVISYEVELYPASYYSRFAVKPGLTGLWQVSGRSHRTYHEMIHFDIEYAQRRTLGLDLTILRKTIPVVLRRHGAA